MTHLSPDLLLRRDALPLKPAPIKMSGQFVRLEPLDVGHAQGLYSRSNGSPIDLAGRAYAAYDADELIWRYLFDGPFSDLAAFERYVQATVAGADRLALCVIEKGAASPSGLST